MKIITNRWLRLALLTFVIAAAEAIGSGGAVGTVAVFAEVFAFLWLLWTLFTMLRDRKRRSNFDLGGTIYKAVMRVLGPIFTRMRRRNDRKTYFIKGKDSRELLRGGQYTKEKRRRVKQKRINVDSEGENGAKIRLLYVKYVLRSVERGDELTLSHTPYEIKTIGCREGEEEIFDVYNRVRYGEAPAADDDEVSRCTDIAEKA